MVMDEDEDEQTDLAPLIKVLTPIPTREYSNAQSLRGPVFKRWRKPRIHFRSIKATLLIPK